MGAATEARVRTFYYPHWIATANGTRLATRPAEDGAILVSVPPNATEISLEFQEPSRVHKAELLSLVSWMLIGLLVTSQATLAVLRRRAASSPRRPLLLQHQ
jgi:hypothetical protein